MTFSLSGAAQPTAVLEQLALQAIRAQNYAVAAELYQQAVAQGDATAAAYSNLAALELQSNRIEAAAALLEHALRLAPNNAEAWLNLGTAQHALGRSAKAVERFLLSCCFSALEPIPQTNHGQGIRQPWPCPASDP